MQGEVVLLGTLMRLSQSHVVQGTVPRQQYSVAEQPHVAVWVEPWVPGTRSRDYMCTL